MLMLTRHFDALSRYKYATRQSLQLSTSSARTRKFETVQKSKTILLINAVSVYVTTSAIYRKGKAAALKTLESIEELQRRIGVFYIKTSSCEKISSCDESYLAALYKAPNSIATLNKVRYLAYNTLVAREKVSAAFDMVALPPQNLAAKQHSYRIFHHLQK